MIGAHDDVFPFVALGRTHHWNFSDGALILWFFSVTCCWLIRLNDASLINYGVWTELSYVGKIYFFTTFSWRWIITRRHIQRQLLRSNLLVLTWRSNLLWIRANCYFGWIVRLSYATIVFCHWSARWINPTHSWRHLWMCINNWLLLLSWWVNTRTVCRDSSWIGGRLLSISRGRSKFLLGHWLYNRFTVFSKLWIFTRLWTTWLQFHWSGPWGTLT